MENKVSQNNKVVVFDLDGTLADTLTDLTNSVNFAMISLNLPTYSKEQVRAMVGNGVSVLMQRAVTEKYVHLHDRALQLQRLFYALHSEDNTHPFGGITRMLEKLKEMGAIIIVHTNKDENVAKPLCQKMFGSLVDYVCGTVEGSATKPNAERLLQLLESIGSTSAVYCGDSEVDIQTANNAGLPCISVTWGFRTKFFLIIKRARYFADTPNDVVEIAEKLLSN